MVDGQEQEAADPKLWAKVYPRVYDPSFKPHLYASPKTLARRMMNTVHKMRSGHFKESEVHELMWVSQMVRHNVPLFWLAPDLVTAVLQTRPPIELHWHDMELPFEAMTFMVPRNMITHELEGNVEFVSFARTRKDVAFPNILFPGKTLRSSNGAFVMLINTEPQLLTHWILPYDDYPTLNLQELDNVVNGYENIQFASGWLQEHSITPADTKVGALVSNLIFGLILLMLRKPELITQSSLLRRVPGKRGEAPKEFWSPAIIGEHYKLRKEVVHLGGTHASPVGHWVRGFWRDQHYGVGRVMVKEQWIEPYWRGGGEHES